MENTIGSRNTMDTIGFQVHINGVFMHDILLLIVGERKLHSDFQLCVTKIQVSLYKASMCNTRCALAQSRC